MIGAAPYSVTKHGAYAFAEYLSLTYRHRGIKVHAICPQGVRTDMLDATGSAGDLVLKPTAIAPEDVADALFKGMAEDLFLILPHPEVAGYYEARAGDPDRLGAGPRGRAKAAGGPGPGPVRNRADQLPLGHKRNPKGATNTHGN